eukprot:Awhi_evm1s1332
MLSQHIVNPWLQSIQAHNEGNYDASVEIMNKVVEHIGAKAYYNISQAYYWNGYQEQAIESIERCIELDQFSAIARFFYGNLLFNQSVEKSLAAYDKAYTCMRDNNQIDYTTLGMNKRFFASDILFNRAVCKFSLGQFDNALKDIDLAFAVVVGDERIIALESLKSFIENDRDEESHWIPIQLECSCIYRPKEQNKTEQNKFEMNLGMHNGESHITGPAIETVTLRKQNSFSSRLKNSTSFRKAKNRPTHLKDITTDTTANSPSTSPSSLSTLIHSLKPASRIII